MISKSVLIKKDCKKSFTFCKKISNDELLIFVQSVCEFLKISKDIYFCIESSLHCVKSNKIEIFKEVLSKIKQGEVLSIAFINARIFPMSFIRFLKLGEKSNDISKAFYSYNEFLVWHNEHKKKLITSLIYPIFSLFAFSFVIFLFSNYVIPQLFDMLNAINNGQGKCELFLLAVFALKVVVSVVILFCFIMLICFFYDREKFDIVAFRLPIFGNIMKYNSIYMNAYYIANSLTYGASINESFDLAISCNDGIVNKILNEVKVDLNKGLKIHQSLKKIKLLPEIVCSIIETGEESGSLLNAFDLLKQIFCLRYKMLVERLIVLLPNILILLIASMIIGFVLLVFGPLYSLNF